MRVGKFYVFVLMCVFVLNFIGGSICLGVRSQPVSTRSCGDEIVAKVSGKVLTKKDVEFIKKMFMPRVDEKRIIYLWVINTELADEARKEGLADRPEVRSVISFAQNEVLATLYVKKRQENVTVSDEEAKKYYEEHKEEFRSMPYVSVKMIATEKKEDAEKIKKELLQGADFDKLADKYKQQTLKLTGFSDVYLKEISARDLIKPFGPPIAYTMANVKDFKRVIGPRRFSKGWLLFKVVGRKKGEYIPYEKVASRLKYQLKRRKLSRIRRELIEQAEKKTGVKPPVSKNAKRMSVPKVNNNKSGKGVQKKDKTEKKGKQ